MKRKLCLLTAMLLLGIYAAFYLPYVLLAWITVVLLLAGIAKWALSGHSSGWVYTVAAFMFLLGSILLLWRGDVSQKKLYPFLDEYVDVTAEVVSRPQQAGDGFAFRANITELSFLKQNITLRETVRLRCYEKNELHYGDVFTARVRLNLPNEASNKGGFDYSLYLKTNNIFFNGYIDGGSLNIIGRKQENLYDKIRGLGFRCGDLIDRTLTPKTACILKGILLGDKTDIDDELQDAFARSGLSHIVAVSGTHISALLVIFFGIFQLFGISRRRAGVFAILFLLFFICMIGAPASAVRAGVMASLAIFAEFIYRKSDTFITLSAAAMVILCVQPFAAFDPSFLLSFGAVLGILLFQPKIEKTVFGWLNAKGKLRKDNSHRMGSLFRKVLRMLITAVSAQLLIVPIILFLFQEFTFWGLLTNLLVLPLLPFVLGAGAALCVFGAIWEPLALFPGGLCYLALLAIRKIVLFFGTMNFGYIIFGNVTAFFVFFYFLLILAFYLLLCEHKQIFALIPAGSALTLICVLTLKGIFSPPTAYVRFINVGQGDCSCISLSGGTNILIDAGGTPSYRTYYDIGREIVRPYLLQNNINEISFMIASHGHDDHIQGLSSIMQEMHVGYLAVPKGFGATEEGKQLLDMAAQKEVPVVELAEGDKIILSEYSCITALMPTADWADNLPADRENERSLVIRFDFGENSFLYTGDMEKDGEEKLIEEAKEQLNTDVLKVAHHGSKNATSEAFLDAVLPTYAVIPVGKNNFGHPDDNVLSRLYEHSTTVFRTDINRDVVFTLDPKQILNISYTR